MIVIGKVNRRPTGVQRFKAKKMTKQLAVASSCTNEMKRKRSLTPPPLNSLPPSKRSKPDPCASSNVIDEEVAIDPVKHSLEVLRKTPYYHNYLAKRCLVTGVEEEKEKAEQREIDRRNARLAVENVKPTLHLEPSWCSVLTQLESLPGFDARSWGTEQVSVLLNKTDQGMLKGRNVDALILNFGEDPAKCPFDQVIPTLLKFVRMLIKSHEENCKQSELEMNEAAVSEKVKRGASKQSERLLRTPIHSSNAK